MGHYNLKMVYYENKVKRMEIRNLKKALSFTHGIMGDHLCERPLAG